MLYPFYYALIVSISDPIEVVKGTATLIPRGFNLEAYGIILKSPEVLDAYMNSIIYAVGGTAATVVVTLLAAYPFVGKAFQGQAVLFLCLRRYDVLQRGMIPTYLVIKNLGLIDSRLAIILPPAFGVFYIIILRTGISGIPDSLSESPTWMVQAISLSFCG